MNQKQKNIILCMILAMLLVLSGCTGNGPKTKVKLSADNPVAIRIWHYYNDEQKIAFDELIDEFNETVGREKGITVEATGKGSVNELTDAVLASANKEVGAEELPNIFSAYADTALQIDKLGLVASLDQYLTEKEIEAYIPGYIEEGRFDSEENLKIFPVAKSTEVMMLNKTDWDKFAAATGASLEDLATVEGVTKVSEAYYNWSGGKAFFNRDALANYILVGAKQLGVDIFSTKNGEVSLNLDEKVMRKLWDNYYVPYIKGYFASKGKYSSDDAKTGDILAFVGSTTAATYYPNEVIVSDDERYAIETVVLEAPQFKDGENIAVQQGAGMVVSKTTAKEEYAATILLKWLTDSARNCDFSITTGYLPVKTEASTTEALRDAIERVGEESIDNNLRKSLQAAVKTTENNTMFKSPVFDGAMNTRNTLDYALKDKAKADRASIEAAIAAGETPENAVAKYNTEDNFKGFIKTIKADLESQLQQ